MERQQSPGDQASTWARLASDGFADAARYLQTVPDAEWSGPSGASEWTIRHLAGHIAGEAVWFANLARGVTRGEAPYPSSRYSEMMGWESGKLTEQIAQAADEIPTVVDEATEDDLEAPVDMGFSKMPLWRATFISAVEGVFHGWDTKARREPHAQVPEEWAVAIAPGLTDFAPSIAHRSRVYGAEGVYLLEVEGFGLVTIVARGRKVTVERGAHDTPDVTVIVTADEYVRLLTGRLGADAEAVRVEGDRARVTGLTHIFGGIANGD